MDEAPPLSLDAAYDEIDQHIDAIGRLRAAIADRIKEQNRRASEVVAVGETELTSAEARVARLLVTPMRAPEIAAALHISVNTVKTHMKNTYRKLGASTRHEAVSALRAQGVNL